MFFSVCLEVAPGEPYGEMCLATIFCWELEMLLLVVAREQCMRERDLPLPFIVLAGVRHLDLTQSALETWGWCIQTTLFLSVCRPANSVRPFHFWRWNCKVDRPRCPTRRWRHLYLSGWKQHRTGILQCSGHSQRWISQHAVITARIFFTYCLPNTYCFPLNLASLREVIVSGFHVFSKLLSSRYVFFPFDVCQATEVLQDCET